MNNQIINKNNIASIVGFFDCNDIVVNDKQQYLIIPLKKFDENYNIQKVNEFRIPFSNEKEVETLNIFLTNLNNKKNAKAENNIQRRFCMAMIVYEVRYDYNLLITAKYDDLKIPKELK